MCTTENNVKKEDLKYHDVTNKNETHVKNRYTFQKGREATPSMT